MRELRIHGDNIVECYRAFDLILDSVSPHSQELDAAPLHAPRHIVSLQDGSQLAIAMFPGYGRWSFGIEDHLAALGAPLPEATDAVITELIDGTALGQDSQEQILLAIEFCGALPAGNNAWQRCGRSLSAAIVGMPYLYISEVGGHEHSSDRILKAPRFPNPLVPLAYLTQTEFSATFALPVYLPAPSASDELKEEMASLPTVKALTALVRAVIFRENFEESVNALKQAGLEAVVSVAERRRKREISADEWRTLAAASSEERIATLIRKGIEWRKKVTIPTTPSFDFLHRLLQKHGVACASAEMPFGIIPETTRASLIEDLRENELYRNESLRPFRSWVTDGEGPLLVVLVAGFKPKGDDSRPDRGLVPLVRMLFGPDVDILTIVYGPGSLASIKRAKETPEQAVRANGLWASVLTLSDRTLVDAVNTPLPMDIDSNRVSAPFRDSAVPSLSAASRNTAYGEHDVDSVIKQLVNQSGGAMFEGMCNPPGGDWSGISLLGPTDGAEFRWVSLPRVSGPHRKRPDHVLQVRSSVESNALLSVESKNRPVDFESRIGEKLRRYLEELIEHSPTVLRFEEEPWRLAKGVDIVWPDPGLANTPVLAVGAYCANSAKEEALHVFRSHDLDLLLAMEFSSSGACLIRIITNSSARLAARSFVSAAEPLTPWVEIKVDAFADEIE